MLPFSFSGCRPGRARLSAVLRPIVRPRTSVFAWRVKLAGAVRRPLCHLFQMASVRGQPLLKDRIVVLANHRVAFCGLPAGERNRPTMSARFIGAMNLGTPV